MIDNPNNKLQKLQISDHRHFSRCRVMGLNTLLCYAFLSILVCWWSLADVDVLKRFIYIMINRSFDVFGFTDEAVHQLLKLLWSLQSTVRQGYLHTSIILEVVLIEVGWEVEDVFGLILLGEDIPCFSIIIIMTVKLPRQSITHSKHTRTILLSEDNQFRLSTSLSRLHPRLQSCYHFMFSLHSKWPRLRDITLTIVFFVLDDSMLHDRIGIVGHFNNLQGCLFLGSLLQRLQRRLWLLQKLL